MTFLFTFFKNIKPWQKIILAVIAGTCTGLLLGSYATYLKPIGQLFINAINMMIIPVVFTAIVCAVLAMEDAKQMRRVGIKAIGLYAVSMMISAIIGLFMATLIQPGRGLHGLNAQTAIGNVSAAPTLTEAIVNMIPANAVSAFANGNIIQILVFAFILGLSINFAGEKAKPIAQLFKSFSAVTLKLTELVMRFAPIGIFSLMAWVAGEYGLSALLPLIKLVATIYLSCALLILVFYSLALLLIARVNPIHFFQAILEAMVVAFSTSSSAATLPVTMRCAEQKLGISKSLSGFLLPLGTTMNLNGLSIYLGVATVFAANIYGLELTLSHFVTIVFTILLTCMGAGGVPGSGIIVMSAVMSSVGLPLGAISLIAGVDRLNDMAQTTTNVTGDLFAAMVVAKSEDEIDAANNVLAASEEA